jgi:glutaredoxin
MLEVDQLDHLRGTGAPLILGYGDYECPYSRKAYRDDSGGQHVLAGIRGDVESGIASGEVHGTPTLFINGTVHRGSYDAAALLEAISS